MKFRSKLSREAYYANCRAERAKAIADRDSEQVVVVRIAYFCGRAAAKWERTSILFRMLFSSEHYRARIGDRCLRMAWKAAVKVAGDNHG